MPKKRNFEDILRDEMNASGVFRVCDNPSCEFEGLYRAPKSRNNINEYYWFCLEHVREYNKSWNYFENSAEKEIEDFRYDAMLGHRPTWQFGLGNKSTDALKTAFRQFMNGSFSDKIPNSSEEKEVRKLTQKEKKSFAVLELDINSDKKAIKKRYKELVKKYHPDVNKDNKHSEERFKQVTEAYKILFESKNI